MKEQLLEAATLTLLKRLQAAKRLDTPAIRLIYLFHFKVNGDRGTASLGTTDSNHALVAFHFRWGELDQEWNIESVQGAANDTLSILHTPHDEDPPVETSPWYVRNPKARGVCRQERITCSYDALVSLLGTPIDKQGVAGYDGDGKVQVEFGANPVDDPNNWVSVWDYKSPTTPECNVHWSVYASSPRTMREFLALIRDTA